MSRPLLLTVGRNPIPLLLTMLHARPGVAAFVTSDEVGYLPDLLLDAYSDLTRTRPDRSDSGWPEVRAHDPSSVRACVAGINDLGGYDLGFTGGTAVMAAVTNSQWRSAVADNDDAEAFYVRPDGSTVGTRCRRDPIAVTVPRSLDPLHLGRLHDVLELSSGDAHEDAKSVCLPSARPTDGAEFERCVGSAVIAATGGAGRGVTWLNPTLVLRHAITRGTGSREVELDVVHVRGLQLFYVSCKAKKLRRPELLLTASEAVARARQLGGDLARPGVACWDPTEPADAAMGLMPHVEVFTWRDLERAHAASGARGNGGGRLAKWLAS